ncbi:ABC transporter substrate-binding protein [Angustibacter aerolatus]
MPELVVGSFSPSVLLRVARRSGRLEQHDLRVTETPVASSPGQFRSLLAGELDAALTSPDNVVAYRFDPANPLGERADVRIVTAIDRGLGLALHLRPGLDPSDPESLRGRVFGVDVATSGFAFGMYELARDAGLEPGSYEVVALGSTPRRLEALLEGRCDATMLNAGNELLAEQGGAPRLGRLTDVRSPYLGTVLAVAGEAHLTAATALGRVLTETARAIVSGELHDDAVDEAVDALGLPAALADRYVAQLADPEQGLVLDGLVDPAALRTLVELRRTHLPGPHLDAALDPTSGLVVEGASA